jgi:hypothetical protein
MPAFPRLLAGGAAVVAALGLAAPAAFAHEAGGGDARPEPTEEQRAAREAFRACLEENGVTRPEPRAEGQPPSDEQAAKPDRAALERAYEACKDKLPVPPGVSDEEFRAHQAAIEEYRACMSEHGVETDVPRFGRGRGRGHHGPGRRGPDGAPPDEEPAVDPDTLEKAAEACRDKFPRPPGVSEEERAEREAAHEAFRTCMAEQGVELQEHVPLVRPSRPADDEREARRAAFEACRDQLPERPRGGPPAPEGEGQAA